MGQLEPTGIFPEKEKDASHGAQNFDNHVERGILLGGNLLMASLVEA